MDGIGEIDDGAVHRQRDNIPLGGEDKNLLRGDVRFDGFYQVLHIVGFLLGFQNLANPRKAHLQAVLSFQPHLVLPVGGNTVFGGVVHIPGADLHLKGDALLINDGGVKGLVHVLLGGGDIVLKAVGNRLEHIVDDAQDVVAFQHRIHNNPHRVDVVNLVHIAALHIHLAVDAVDAFHPSVNLGLDMLFLQALVDPHNDALQKGLALLLPEGQLAFDIGVGDGVQVLEGNILQLLLHPPYAQAMGQGRIDLHGFQRLNPALFIGEGFKGAGVVEAVRQLDDNNPHILGHCQQHFADIFRLLVLPRGKGDAPQLCDPIH